VAKVKKNLNFVVVILLLYCGYIVTFIKVLTVYLKFTPSIIFSFISPSPPFLE
jgi:hypothetical protein